MFEFLKDKYYFSLDKKYNGDFEGGVVGFDKEINKLIVKGEDDSGEQTIETDVFNGQFTQDINEYDNWENKLYNKLKNDGITEINVLSTDSDDNWGIKIYKKETRFDYTNSANEEYVTLVNYGIIVEEKVVGEILSFQKTSGQDEKDKFIQWINNQLNIVKYFIDCMDAITICDAFNSNEEIDLIWDMFWNMNIKKDS